METTLFAVSGDAIRIGSNDARVFGLADRLWERESQEARAGRPIELGITVQPGHAGGPLPERELAWEIGDDRYAASVAGLLALRIDLPGARANAEVTEGLLETTPSFVVRTLLEAPVAVLLCRRGLTALHAGAVVGPAGAVVIRGAGGAGKSTLVAACRASGLGFLGDESLLVDRESPDRLESTLRDLVLTPESSRLLGLDGASTPVLSGGERKRRLPLPEPRVPADRLAVRVATVLLGPREPGPARLEAVSGAPFLEAFAEGEIPQERMYDGAPETIAHAWDGAGTWRLLGAVDLSGAVDRIRDLVHGITRR